MGADSRVLLLGLRIWQLICSVIVLGILGSFLHRLSDAGVSRDGRVVYSIVTASISTVFSIVFIAPFLYDFLAFPGDFILWIMWLITFCLLITVRARLYLFLTQPLRDRTQADPFSQRTGGSTCTSPWFWDYWGYYWGGWWRRPTIVTGPADIGYSGCAQWRTVLAFSFMAMFAFFVSPILVRCFGRGCSHTSNTANPGGQQGAYAVVRYWKGTKDDERTEKVR